MSNSIQSNQETEVFNVTTTNNSNLVQSFPNEQNDHTNTSVRFLNGRENVSIHTIQAHLTYF